MEPTLKGDLGCAHTHDRMQRVVRIPPAAMQVEGGEIPVGGSRSVP